MIRGKLGDSFDVVKRFWGEVLAEWAPLYADNQFLPECLQRDFTRLTGIEMLAGNRTGNYSILNDPDTGISLPSAKKPAKAPTHISIQTIVEQLRTEGDGPSCVITFDQAFGRSKGSNREKQLCEKLSSMHGRCVPAFYYDSHAAFLFAFPDMKCLEYLRNRLITFGIPDCRLKAS